MLRILVTGSNGLLGQKLSKVIQSSNDAYLIATGRKLSAIQIDRGEFHLLDITRKSEFENAISLTRPDVIINTAALTMVDECEKNRDVCWEANVSSVQNLASLCEKHQVHLVHLSTDFVFDGSHGPLDEEAVPSPVNFYGESKLEGESIIQKMKAEWCIIRTVLVYGITEDMSRSNIVLWVKKSLEDKKAIRVVNDQFRTPTLAEDLAMGCFLAATKKAKGIFHISGNELMTPYELAVRTAEFFELDKSLIHPTDSASLQQPAQRPAKTGFLIGKAQRELGFQPRTFHEGLALLRGQMKP
ncbi:MAG TPA: SDR family oxidoreductase [Chryseosolibacter sp.]|nr:SDR family oxidoreductase [Chryseosolibacter sp.]